MTSRGRMGVMVIVPAFPKGQPGHPPVVARIVTRCEPAASPHVCRGVDQPGRVQTQDHAQAQPPSDIGPPTEGIESETQEDNGPEVEPVETTLNGVSHQVRGIAMQDGWGMLLCPTHQNPAHVSPPAAVARTVWISLLV